MSGVTRMLNSNYDARIGKCLTPWRAIRGGGYFSNKYLAVQTGLVARDVDRPRKNMLQFAAHSLSITY